MAHVKYLIDPLADDWRQYSKMTTPGDGEVNVYERLRGSHVHQVLTVVYVRGMWTVTFQNGRFAVTEQSTARTAALYALNAALVARRVDITTTLAQQASAPSPAATVAA